MRSKLLMVCGIALMLNFCGITSHAQDVENTDETTPTTMKTSKPIAVSILAGTAGIGAEVKKSVADDWTLRLGMNVLPFSFTKVEQMGNVVVNGFYKARFTNIHLLADYDIHVTDNFQFRATAGLGVFTKALVNVHLTPVGDYYYGDIQLNDGTMGDAHLTADWKGVAPYLGIGFGKAIPTNRLNLSLDLGTYYFVSSAKVEMQTSGYLQGNERQRKQIQDNLKSYTWLPTLQLSVNYKL